MTLLIIRRIVILLHRKLYTLPFPHNYILWYSTAKCSFYNFRSSKFSPNPLMPKGGTQARTNVIVSWIVSILLFAIVSTQRIETARSVKKEECEVDTSVGCKADGKSTAVTPKDCLSLLTLNRYVYPAHTNMDDFSSSKTVATWYHLIVCHVGDKKIG